MREGELYKKLHGFQAGYTRVNGDLIRKDDYVNLVLDEAKRDFLEAVNTDENYVTINRNEIAVWEWFKKWFEGDEDK